LIDAKLDVTAAWASRNVVQAIMRAGKDCHPAISAETGQGTTRGIG